MDLYIYMFIYLYLYIYFMYICLCAVRQGLKTRAPSAGPPARPASPRVASPRPWAHRNPVKRRSAQGFCFGCSQGPTRGFRQLIQGSMSASIGFMWAFQDCQRLCSSACPKRTHTTIPQGSTPTWGPGRVALPYQDSTYEKRTAPFPHEQGGV